MEESSDNLQSEDNAVNSPPQPPLQVFLNNVKSSLITGSDPESVYIPKLWYYGNLSFLQDQDLPQRSSTPTSILDDLPFGEDESVDSMEDVLSPGNSNSSITSVFKRPPPKVAVILEKIAKRMDRPSLSPVPEIPKQPHEAFGQYVAEKLRSIKQTMVPFCQKLINDDIFLAEIDSLNVTSRIKTEVPPPSITPINAVMQAYFGDRGESQYKNL